MLFISKVFNRTSKKQLDCNITYLKAMYVEKNNEQLSFTLLKKQIFNKAGLQKEKQTLTNVTTCRERNHDVQIPFYIRKVKINKEKNHFF